MKNKVELKKAILISIIIFIILSIVFLILKHLEYKKYTEVFNTKIDIIIGEIKQKYPEVKINEIIEMLEQEETDTKSLLKDYGIDLSKDTAILENDKQFAKHLILELAVVCILFISLSAIFLLYNNKKDKTLKEITRCIEEINKRNYKLDIADNTEDELSILKNEIYKTTIMLKEVAENSKEDKIKLKDSLSDISHQLKTPLTSITISLDNMLDNKDMEEKTRIEFIKDIKREVTNLSFLVNALLKLSKFDANTIKFINKDEYVKNIVESAIQKVAGLCDLKNVEISDRGNEEDSVYCDSKWQVEAITNILKNCIEHSEEGTKIDISYEENNVYTMIRIVDNGSGIDEEDLPHIFERFYKGKNSANDSVGIGLALAKSIIEENNGYVNVESEMGIGTIFVIKYFKG
ncbi:MAG: HAMP domain-containing histidine kinase [Clostridia bacterium]|nr:HAMP domain-containing histidine kinase [Clostridia bacterium]